MNTYPKLKFLLLLLTSFVLFSSCKNEAVAPSTAGDPFVGTFAIAETITHPDNRRSENKYAITITTSSTDRSAIEISNFGGFLAKKVQAIVDGNTFTIPAQVFKSNTNSQITITGLGTLNGNTLTYTYTVRGDFKWDATCASAQK